MVILVFSMVFYAGPVYLYVLPFQLPEFATQLRNGMLVVSRKGDFEVVTGPDRWQILSGTLPSPLLADTRIMIVPLWN